MSDGFHTIAEVVDDSVFVMPQFAAAAVIWLIAEGVSYITGAVFYSFNKTKYMHSVFHFFVLAGSVCHIIAVWDVLMEQL